jgi:hypothetical protein
MLRCDVVVDVLQVVEVHIGLRKENMGKRRFVAEEWRRWSIPVEKREKKEIAEAYHAHTLILSYIQDAVHGDLRGANQWLIGRVDRAARLRSIWEWV